MSVTLEVSQNGNVLLSKRDSDKFQQICLTRQQWLTLAEKEEELVTAMDQRRGGHSCVIHEMTPDCQLRATISLYENIVCLSIRVWHRDQATKQGVSMSRASFESIRPMLKPDRELLIGFSVWTDMLAEELKKLKEKSCAGCQKAYPSQRDHDCLSTKSEYVAQFIDQAPRVSPPEFITRLADSARDQGIIIYTPYITYQLCDKVYRTKLEGDYLKQFEDSHY